MKKELLYPFDANYILAKKKKTLDEWAIAWYLNNCK